MPGVGWLLTSAGAGFVDLCASVSVDSVHSIRGDTRALIGESSHTIRLQRLDRRFRRFLRLGEISLGRDRMTPTSRGARGSWMANAQDPNTRPEGLWRYQKLNPSGSSSSSGESQRGSDRLCHRAPGSCPMRYAQPYIVTWANIHSFLAPYFLACSGPVRPVEMRSLSSTHPSRDLAGPWPFVSFPTYPNENFPNFLYSIGMACQAPRLHRCSLHRGNLDHAYDCRSMLVL